MSSSDLRFPTIFIWILLGMLMFVPHIFMSSVIHEKFYVYKHFNVGTYHTSNISLAHKAQTKGYVPCVLQCLSLEGCSIAHFNGRNGSCISTDMSHWDGLKDVDDEVAIISQAVVNDLPDIIMLQGFPGYYLVVSHMIRSYVDALAYCKEALGPSAHLVWLETWDEEYAIVNKLKDMGVPKEKYFIIGLNDRLEEGTFVWGDPTERRTKPILYDRFKKGEPNNHAGQEDCVYALFFSDFETGWNDRNCNNKARFICELDMM